MDLRVSEDKYTNFLIKLLKVDCFNIIKKPIKCANDCVSAIPGISVSVEGDLHIDAD